MADGWRCPSCALVLSPHVAVHRCDPPTAGVTTVAPYPGPVPTLTVFGTEYPVLAPHTTGHLTVASSYLTAVPDTGGMRAITEGAA